MYYEKEPFGPTVIHITAGKLAILILCVYLASFVMGGLTYHFTQVTACKEELIHD